MSELASEKPSHAETAPQPIAPAHRARDEEPAASRWRSAGESAMAGIRVALAAATGLWLGDVALLATGGAGVSRLNWLTGVGAALFVATTTAVAVGAAAGMIVVPLYAPVLFELRAWWSAFRRGEPGARRVLTAGFVTFIPLAAVWTALAYRGLSVIELSFARPDTIGGADVALFWVLASTFAVAWRSSQLKVRAFLESSSGSRAAKLWNAAWLGPAMVATVAIGGVAVFGLVYRQELGSLPWDNVLPLVTAILGVAVLGALRWGERRPWRRAASVVLGSLGAILFAGSCVAAARLHPESTTARRLGFERAMSGALGYAAWTFALDFDRDGQIGVLGGGDCAPFDPRRYTGAVDIPGNGIDEDCDGTDLAPMTIVPRSWSASPPASTPMRPTIVLVTVDALGAPRLAALGESPPLMPNLDAFAARSLLFTQAFSQGPSTRLSFPSMFTSRWDSQQQFEVGPRLPYSFVSTQRQLQDVLDDAGYETVAVIPNEYFDRSRWPSVTRGFQRVDTSALALGKHNAAQVTDAALRILSEDHTQPLYLWVHYYDAHPPYLTIPGVQYPHYGDQALYDAELTHIDDEMARLLSALEERSDPTYVFVTADHSTVFHPNPVSHPHHYGYDLYSATLHVPLIVHGPGVRTGRTDGIVSTMDIAPTITDLLRWSDRTARFEGSTLVPALFADTRPDPERATFHEFYLPERLFHGYEPLEMVSVHRGTWNLILNRLSGTYELYDWQKDYFEQNDLYEDQVRTPEVAHLRSLLAAFVLQYGRQELSLAAQPSADRRFLSPGEP